MPDRPSGVIQTGVGTGDGDLKKISVGPWRFNGKAPERRKGSGTGFTGKNPD